MPTTLLTSPRRPTGSSPSPRPRSNGAERELRRRLAQTRAALEASKRDNEALRRSVDRLLAENRRHEVRPEPRMTTAQRKRRMADALNEPYSCNP